MKTVSCSKTATNWFPKGLKQMKNVWAERATKIDENVMHKTKLRFLALVEWPRGKVRISSDLIADIRCQTNFWPPPPLLQVAFLENPVEMFNQHFNFPRSIDNCSWKIAMKFSLRRIGIDSSPKPKYEDFFRFSVAVCGWTSLSARTSAPSEPLASRSSQSFQKTMEALKISRDSCCEKSNVYDNTLKLEAISEAKLRLRLLHVRLPFWSFTMTFGKNLFWSSK